MIITYTDNNQQKFLKNLVAQVGLEPKTFDLLVQCSTNNCATEHWGQCVSASISRNPPEPLNCSKFAWSLGHSKNNHTGGGRKIWLSSTGGQGAPHEAFCIPRRLLPFPTEFGPKTIEKLA